MVAQGFTDQGKTTADNLLAGEFPRVATLVTISGGDYKRGMILGKITTSGAYTGCASAASDGSQKPSAILAEAVDASSEDKQAVVYFTGEFNSKALISATGNTVASLKNDLRANSIFLHTNQPY